MAIYCRKLPGMSRALPLLAVCVSCVAPPPQPPQPAVASNKSVSVPILQACGSAFQLMDGDEPRQRPGSHVAGPFFCRWPDAADEPGIRSAGVVFRACVDADGRPRGMVV